MAQSLGDRLKESREKRGLTQGQAAEILGISLRSLQGHELNEHRPGNSLLNKYVRLYNCDKIWLLSGDDVPFPGEEVDNKPYLNDRPGVEYKKIDESFGTAVDALKEIFDSHDPALIDAVRANLQIFRLYARKDRQINQQSKKIQKLKEECEELKKKVDALEKGALGNARVGSGSLYLSGDATRKKET